MHLLLVLAYFDTTLYVTFELIQEPQVFRYLCVFLLLELPEVLLSLVLQSLHLFIALSLPLANPFTTRSP